MDKVQEVTALDQLALYCHKRKASYKVGCHHFLGGSCYAQIEFEDGTEARSNGQDIESTIYKLLEKLED